MKKSALLMLPMLALLSACTQTRLTPSTATGHEPLVCSQWRVITYASKHDTADTVAQVRRNNAARAAYCAK